jgi:LmbE family N-acetylglucosaminyl deacetylase
MKNPVWIVLSLCFFLNFFASAQQKTSSQLYHDLLKLQETKRVLYIAAHPDDENTRLIGFLANDLHAQVGYLSLTRGDGGQNLIGKELGIELGLIRTNELLKARETDGGRQFFSRAMDFGFSKHPDETFNNWDKDKLLSDVIWVVRKFQPDIIINRFNTIPGNNHGHHTASAILSVEAFGKASDPKVFPNHLQSVEPWQPHRIFWNAYNWGGQYEAQEGKTFHKFSVGEFNPLLGKTYSKIAADSRTMHKSQGFGSTAQIGQGNDFIELIDGPKFEKDPFEGIPNRWDALKDGKAIQEAIQQALSNFDFLEPSNNLPKLLNIKKLLDAQKNQDQWLIEKKDQINHLILLHLPVQAEFVIKKEIGYPGEKIAAELVFNNGSQVPVRVLAFNGKLFNQPLDQTISNNIPLVKPLEIQIPQDYPVSQPFWLENPLDNNLFGVKEQMQIGQPVGGASISGVLDLELQGQRISFEIPLIYKYNDQVLGEVKQPFTLVPEINVSLDKQNLFLVKGADQSLQVEISFRDKVKEGTLELTGLKPGQYRITNKQIDEKRKKALYTVELKDSDVEKRSVTVTFLTLDGKKFNQDTKRIIYSHLPNLTYFTSSSFNLLKMDMKVGGQAIGYINGAGDDVPDVLRNLGYKVTVLENGDLKKEKLAAFKTVIVGIRAFNVNQQLAENSDQLMEYVKEGGNLIVQYNTASPLLTRELGPYPFSITRERVTVEQSPVTADFTHQVLSYPNQIKMTDFQNWVQERGLYFVSDFGDKYTAPLAFRDPGEQDLNGSLIHTQYGKGNYTYTSISWFRQLPSGVPGAIKIFVNLIEQGSER